MAKRKRIETQSRSFPISPAVVASGIVGFALFALLTVLVHSRVLVGIDLAAAQAKQAVVGGFFDTWSAAVGIILAAELSAAYSLIASLLLWRAGFGRWSVAPLVWMPFVLLELVLKTVVNQPPVPSDFYRGVYYPLMTVATKGSFPSGHAMRSSFLCVFLAVLLWHRGGLVSRLAALGLVPLLGLLGFARIYLGYHWLSDVVGGMILGGTLALLAATPIASRLGVRTAVRS